MRHHAAEKSSVLITSAKCNPGGHSYLQNPEEKGRDTGKKKTGSVIASHILAWPFLLKKTEFRSQIPLPAIHGSDPRLRAICSSAC